MQPVKPTAQWVDPVKSRDQLPANVNTEVAFAVDESQTFEIYGQPYVWVYKDGKWSEESMLFYMDYLNI